MKIANYIKKLIEITSGDQQKFYVWLQKEGKLYTNFQQLDDQIISNLDIAPKQCFSNSAIVSYSLSKDYICGWMGIEGIPFPIEHAFNFDAKTGSCYDSTSQLVGFEVEERFGVKIPIEFVLENLGHHNFLFLYWKSLNK